MPSANAPAPKAGRIARLLCLPATLWITVLSLVPLLLVAAISFMSRDDIGTLTLPLTLESYSRLLGFGPFGFEPLYPQIFFRTAIIALATTALSLALALPLAFAIRSLPGRWRGVALTLVVVPLWTNLVVRTYAWQLLLGPDSWLAAASASLGWLQPGEGLYPSLGAVLLGMVADYLPFVTLPLYASVERLDWTLVEAAADLGAKGWRLFRHGILPQIWPGLAAGTTLTFIPSLGQFLVPDLLGGGKTLLLGNVLQQQFGTSGDWPFGSAIAVVSLLLVGIASALQRLRKRA